MIEEYVSSRVVEAYDVTVAAKPSITDIPLIFNSGGFVIVVFVNII